MLCGVVQLSTYLRDILSLFSSIINARTKALIPALTRPVPTVEAIFFHRGYKEGVITYSIMFVHLENALKGKVIAAVVWLDDIKRWRLEFTDGSSLFIDVCTTPAVPVLVPYTAEGDVVDIFGN